MSSPLNQRRQLLKASIAFCIAYGLHPLKILASEKGPSVREIEEITEEVSKEITVLLRQYNNKNVLEQMSTAELQGYNNGIMRTVMESKKPAFQNYSSSKKIAKLKELNAFTTPQQVSEQDAKGYYESLQQARDAMSAAISVSSVIYQGALLAGHAMAPTAYALALPPIISVPMFLGSAGMAAWQVYDLIGNNERNRKGQQRDANVASLVLGETVYNRHLSGTSFMFENDIPNFRLSISKTDLNPDTILRSSSTASLPEKQFLTFMKENMSMPAVFANKEELEKFLQKYAEKVGALQKKMVEDLLQSEEEQRQQDALEQRDKAALYQSINHFVGLAISKFAAPREAQILNTLFGAGFQYAIGAGLTPYGWAAVGINIASVMAFGSNGGDFNKVMFKMLLQIQRQLNVIIEKIDVLHQNQLLILKELQNVLKEVQRTQNLVNQGFDAIRLKQNIIYQSILSIEQQKVRADFDSYNRNLKNGVIDRADSFSDDDVFNNLQALKNLVLDRLSMKPFTRFDTVPMDNDVIKSEVLFRSSNFRYNIPLYNTIGMVPVLANYDPGRGFGQSTQQVVHPVEFYIGTNALLNWLLISNISKQRKLIIVNDLLTGAEHSRKILNESASNVKVELKMAQHTQMMNQAVQKIRNYLVTVVDNDFARQSNTLKNIVLTASVRSSLEYFSDPDIKDHNHVNNFYNNRNDKSLINLAIDLGIVQVTTISTKGRKFSAFGSISGTDWVGLKNNKLNIIAAPFDVSKGYSLNAAFDYSRMLYPKDIKYWSGQGVGGYEVKTTRSDETFGNWHDVIKNKVESDLGVSINTYFPHFEKMTIEQFLNHLIGQTLMSRKIEYLKKVKELILPQFKQLDATGLSLMVLTKLNQLITYDSIIPYEVDYFNEVFTVEDIADLVDSIGTVGLREPDETTLKQLVQKYISSGDANTGSGDDGLFYYTLENGQRSARLDPQNFIDFVTILLAKKFKETVDRCAGRINQIKETDAEPHLAEVINNLNGYKKILN